MGPHLDGLAAGLLAEAEALVCAIVVNQENRRNGLLAPQALSGFIACAHRLGMAVGEDRLAFLRDQQLRTFVWGRRL